MSERAYAVGFLAIESVGSGRIRHLRERCGSLAAAWQAPPSQLSEIPGIGPDVAQAIAAQRPEIDPLAELERVERAGVALVCCWEEAYPPHLAELHDPPAVLFVRGVLPNFDQAVAIVGTRKCSPYGVRMARALARDLARSGVVVVSGLALGIDTAAHQGALEGGQTVAVLGGALDRLSPPSNADLAGRIAQQGAVVSEYPLGTEPAPGQFPARNRIVAGLCQAVIVVEARERSGALITADMALDQNREVMAVPGLADSPLSAGPHRLIQQGAKLVTCAADVLDELGWGRLELPAAPAVALEGDEAQVFAVLDASPAPVDRIGARSGLAPATVNVVLLTLELKGLVVQLPGRLYARR
jgi:DNA processing protein